MAIVPFPADCTGGLRVSNTTEFELALYGAKQLKYMLSDHIQDPIAASIREGRHPFFNHFLFLDNKYSLLTSPGDCVIDCGANLGCCALAFGLLGNMVYAFEADPFLAEHVRANAERNALTNVITVPSAVGEAVGEVYFQTGGPYGHIVESGTGSGVRATPCTSLDAWAEGNLRFKVGFIKIDVEGAEIGVLKGARNLLARNELPTILIEINAHTLHWFDATANDVLRLADDIGYRLFRLEPEGLRPMARDALEPQSNVDYLLIAPHRLAHFAPHFLSPWSIGELEEQVIAEVNHSHPHHRACIARTLERFHDTLSSNVLKAVGHLRDDPDQDVRAAVRWMTD